MKVVISGYGKMGHMVEAVLQRRGIELVCASEDVCASPKEVARECVCIDFTTPDAFRANYKTLAANFKAVVVGTTGWNDICTEVFAAFEDAGTPMIWASNFSIGVNAFFAAVERACEVLKGQGFGLDGGGAGEERGGGGRVLEGGGVDADVEGGAADAGHGGESRDAGI